MAERSTKEVETSAHKIKAVLRDWITVGEYREIMSIYLKSAKLTNVDAKKETADIAGSPAEAGILAQDKAIEFVVVSLDGSSENILQRFRDLPSEDGTEIIDAVEAVTNPKKK